MLFNSSGMQREPSLPRVPGPLLCSHEKHNCRFFIVFVVFLLMSEIDFEVERG